MSDLQDLLTALEAVTIEADRHSAELAQHARRIGQAATKAAGVAHGTARREGEQAVMALQSAQRSVSLAAHQLHAAAAAGRTFVARHGAAGGGAGAGRPADPAPSLAQPADRRVHALPGLPEGFVMIPVDLIDQADNPIHGAEDFTKGYSIDDLAHAFDLLEAQVLPGLADGAGRDDFAAIDQTDGVFGSRSLVDTFSGFFGDAAIRLEPRADGTFGITNGRHRVFVASRYGHSFVPARIS